MCMLLDVVEVAKVSENSLCDLVDPFIPLPQSHSGVNLAVVFVQILQEFGKVVDIYLCVPKSVLLYKYVYKGSASTDNNRSEYG
jgi:hypothetical protein